MLPCKGCRGLCCGPVPITQGELKRVTKYIKSMPRKNRMELENQERFPGTCIFYDLANDKCGIHPARPEVCRAFGNYKNLACFRAPEAAKAASWVAKEPPVATLSVDITWKDFK